MARKLTFSIGEWYHCYSRGIDKRTVFEDSGDAGRFLELLYLANDVTPLRREEIREKTPAQLFARLRGDPLVAIGAYALMPNHYHLVLGELREGGLSAFMQKMGTAYTMYFNSKYERTGNLFVKPFRAKHVQDDRYLQHVARYVHLNPAELYEHGWKDGVVVDKENLIKRLREYPYSSLSDHLGIERPIRNILALDAFSLIHFTGERDLVEETSEFYKEIAEGFDT
jgi:putative transposase